MNPEYITRALGFHGQPMRKIWEDERGAGDLQKNGVKQEADYAIYQERQKHFTFQDRAKRLKLHQFLARKGNDLYDKDLAVSTGVIDEKQIENAKPFIAVVPPYEVFVNKNQDKIKRWRAVLEGIKQGDIIYGVITKGLIMSMSTASMMIKPLCTAEPLVRYLSDIPTKAYISPANLVPSTQLDLLRGKPRNYAVNDFVCCEVLDISVDADRLHLGMQGIYTKNKNIKLGLVSAEELPKYYRIANEGECGNYESCLLAAKEYLNPNYDILFEMNGLKAKQSFTLMNSLKCPFPREQYAKELRQAQASKWALRIVVEGIDYFKNGMEVEAFQCLNKALYIDPLNVEGLVARGALYANKSQYLKALDDFYKAIKLNSSHENARQYIAETLVALGRSYEEDNRLKDAAKVYKECLSYIPDHEQARSSLEKLQHISGHVFDQMFNISGVNANATVCGSASTSTSTKVEKRSRSISGNESSSDNGSDSEDSDSSDSSDRRKKELSLSPLSKRMALHAASLEAAHNTSNYTQPFYNNVAQPSLLSRNANDFRLDDDDTETRVRKLLQDASKHKKQKTKKTKKKKAKKLKKHKSKDRDMTAFLEKINFDKAYKAIGGSSLIDAKLNENLQMYEKSIAEIEKRQEVLRKSLATSSLATSTILNMRDGSPPPPPPSLKLQNDEMPSSSRSAFHSSSSSSANNAQPKFSFQIKKPVKIDKFGLVRIATPLAAENVTYSRSRSRSYSPRRRSRRSRSSTRSRSRSRSKSRSKYSNGGRHGRIRREYHNRNDRRDFGSRRRKPSPFVPRSRSPDARRRSKSRDSPNNRRHKSPQQKNRSAQSTTTRVPGGDRPKFGNRVWQRPGYVPPPTTTPKANSPPTAPGGRWLHDKFNEKTDYDPSIEEIDEIINNAQKERKEEIIKRDRDILKKPGRTF